MCLPNARGRDQLNQAILSLEDCTNCPRACHANRLTGPYGYCQTGAGFEIGAICLHQGEEPVINGATGICNIFFTGCNLRCQFCQNFQISHKNELRKSDQLTLAAVVEQVESILNQGTRRVGFVSPSHVLPQMLAIIQALESRQLSLTFIMNTNAYDRVEQLKALQGRIHVYLPDFKYADSKLAAQLSDVPDYPRIAQAALQEMLRQKGTEIKLDAEGAILSGLIVRHLVLPGQLENTKKCLRFLAQEISRDVPISIMSQYHPIPAVQNVPDLNRRLLPHEYDCVLEEIDKLGFTQGWIQEQSSSDYYLPDFNQDHPFKKSPQRD